MMNQSLSKVLVTLFGVSGVLFCYLWISFGNDTTEILQQEAVLENAPPLATAQAGQFTFVEGNISGANPAIRGKLVSFITEEYRSRRRSDWYEVGHNTPPLQVQAADGVDYIANNDYKMVQTPDMVVDTTSGTKIRSRGFTVGDPVTALGKRSTNRHINAHTIFPGTREQYQEYLANRSKADSKNSLFFMVLGIGMVAISLTVGWFSFINPRS